MVISDIGVIIAGVGLLMGLFTILMMMFVNKIDGDIKTCITRLDMHITAINARTDELQKAMMDLIRKRD